MEKPFASLITKEVYSRVSSVLNRDSTFKKENMFDGDEETCWNSDQGSPQKVLIDFGRDVNIEQVHITFQGGFVGKGCSFLTATRDQPKFVEVGPFHPTDSNRKQIFAIRAEGVCKLQLVFKESTDFFGRITIYSLDVVGTEKQE